MPPGQLEEEPRPPKRHRRSRSHSMPQPPVCIDLTESSSQSAELDTSISRKHDRHEQDSQANGPSKRAKLKRNSEPPMRKDTSTTPSRKQKQSRKRINHHKASRTRKHHALKESNKTLERQWWAAIQALKNKKQALEDTKRDLRWTTSELKRVQVARDEKTKTVQNQCLTIQADGQRIQALQDECAAKDEDLRAKDEIIAAKQEELDKTRQELKQALQETEAARALNDSNGYHNHMCKRRELKAKETLKIARKEHDENLSALDEEKVELQQQYADLESRLTSREAELSEMIASLQLQLQDSRPQSQRYNFKLSDEKVKQDFANLESKVQQFVDKYARPVLNATDQQLDVVWPSWSPELRKFLGSPLLCHLVFEGYVWECLLRRIFTPWSKIWVGDLGRPLEKALRIAEGEAENAGSKSDPYVDYQYWRSNSSSFINSLNGGDFRPKHFDLDVEAMVSNLTTLCELHDFTEIMKAEAMSIFEDARDFEIQLRMLKAVYTFRMSKLVLSGETLKYGMFFDEDGMIDRSPSPSDKKHGRVPAVDFIMSPGLHKRGNNDGDMYEDETWLVKMGVVCDAAKFLMKSDHSTTARSISVQIAKAPDSGEVKQENEDHGVMLPSLTGCTADDVKFGTPMLDSPDVKVEEPISEQSPDPLSTPNLTSGSPAPKAHDAAQMQSGTVPKMRTRSQGPPEPDNNVHDDKSSIKSEDNHP